MTVGLAVPPTRTTRAAHRFWIWVVVVVAAGLAWRLVYTYLAKGDIAVPGGDGFYYFKQAHVLRDGLGFVDPYAYERSHGQILTPTAGHPPLYALYLTVWTFVGVDTSLGYRLVSCLLGSATILVVALLGRRLGGERTGIIAAVLAAAYPLLWINDAMLLSESMAALTTALALLAAVVFWGRPTWRTAALLGGAVALATLSRAEAVLLFPLVVLPMALRVRGRDWPARLKMLGAAALTAAVLAGPWVVRNLVVFEHPVLLSNGYGATLRGASCDGAWYGPGAGIYSYCPSGRAPGDESERDVVAREEAFDYVGDHLSRLPAIVGIRVARFWDLYEPGRNLSYWAAVEDRGWWPSRAGLYSYYLLVPAAIGGGVLLWRRKRPVLPFIMVALTAMFTAAITYANIRYRIGVEVVLVVLAAVAVDGLWTRLRAT